MRKTKKTLEQLKKFEGCRLEAYRDPLGIWTIGYGHTHGVYNGMTISQETAEEYLVQVIESIEGVMEGIPGCKDLSPNRWDAIVSLAYNIGLGNFKKSTLLKKLQKNPDNPTIYQEFLRWNKAKGKKLDDLTRRRQWEAKRWEGEV